MNCIEIKDLTFKYDDLVCFEHLTINFKFSSFYILSGVNGCGKSTLLKIISGKKLSEYDKVKVLNHDPFRNTSINHHICFIGNEWGTTSVPFTGYSIPICSSLKVKEMMVSLKNKYPERNKELIDVLDINVNWTMNSISEGQRKRVQLYLGMIQPFKICLLDEITVNLDLLIKYKFIKYLKKLTTEQEVCVIYATHIFDDLDKYYTDLIYIDSKKKIDIKKKNEIEDSTLYQYVLDRFKKEDSCVEFVGTKDKILKNAGGYSDGVISENIYKT